MIRHLEKLGNMEGHGNSFRKRETAERDDNHFQISCKIEISKLFSEFQNIYSSLKLCIDIFMFNNCIPSSVIQDKNRLNIQQERFRLGIKKTFLVD